MKTEVQKEATELTLSYIKSLRNEEKPRLSWVSISLIFIFRLFLCITVTTVESPDEWWQSSEIAYNMVYGKGHLPWEWHYGLRSVLFPGIIAIPLFILKYIGLDTPWMVWFISRLIQSFIISAIDICVFNIGANIDADLGVAARIEEEKYKKSIQNPLYEIEIKRNSNANNGIDLVSSFALVLSLCNWYMAFVGVRLYSNVLEALLILLILQQENYKIFLFLSGLACAIRPTSGVVIFPLLFVHISWSIREKGIFKGLMRIFFWGIIMMIIILGSIFLADSSFYNRWILTPYVFFQFNVIQNASRFFGVHSWYFYIIPCLPALVGPHILFSIISPYIIWSEKEFRVVTWRIGGLFAIITWILICYSLVDHKENRFIFTVLPLCFILAGFTLSRLCYKSRNIRIFHCIFLIFNIILALLSCYVYRKGPLEVMEEIRDGPKINRLDIISTCYTTPGLSYIHNKVNHLRLIDCPVHLDSKTGIPKLTEDIMFRRYPKDYVLWKYTGIHTFNKSNEEERIKAIELEKTVVPKSASIPDVMVLFRNTAQEIKKPFLDKHMYRLYRSFLHTPLVFAPFEDVYMEIWVQRTF